MTLIRKKNMTLGEKKKKKGRKTLNNTNHSVYNTTIIIQHII